MGAILFTYYHVDKWGNLVAVDLLPYIVAAVVSIVLICCVVSLVRRVLANPFHYPYFVERFVVSGRRNVKIDDLIDRFMLEPANWEKIVAERSYIQEWKAQQEEYLKTCSLRKRRERQYAETLDDAHAFQFVTCREQTRYRQRNYVKTSYKVSVDDSVMAVSWDWVVNRRNRLAAINDEATLRDYHARNQRKLMTKQLREQIARRDNYTCQMCGKYMPDGVGLHIDHIVPVARGGKTVPSNLQVLCSKCNGRKGAR